jgi:tetratricopeptide (TPR) repeat protein
MRKRQHPTDEHLIDLLDDAPPVPGAERRATEDHLKECDMCSDRLAELREFVTVLRGANVCWDRRMLKIRPRLEWARQASDVVGRILDEMKAAEAEVSGILTGPTAWWRMKAVQATTTHTYGFVRKLLERADGFLGITPASAVEVTLIAAEIAEAIGVNAYPFDLVVSARAHAWREHAYALYFIGRFPAALRAIERAERLFVQLPVPDFELARTRLIRALIYRSTDRVPEALHITRASAEVLRTYGAAGRFARAKMTEAAMLHQQGAIAEALDIWIALENEATLKDDAAFGMLLQNIGTAHSQLGRLDIARSYLARAIEEHDKQGNGPERVRTRWSLASAFVAGGLLDEALPRLRQTQREFDALRMQADAALVALEIAEVLLIMGRPDEVPAICRALLDQFTRNNMESRAITALAFLREAVAMGKATPSLVRHVHDFLRDLPKNHERAFTPPSP